MKYVPFILLGIVILIVLYFLSVIMRYVKRILYPKTKTYDMARDKNKRQGYYPEEYINSLSYEPLNLKSAYGYMIKGRLYPNDSDKYIIIVHGITMNIYGALKYLPFFYKKGFNVVVVDLRNHGETGGDNTTYGYFEKWDLKTVTDYLFNRYGEEISVGLHGESMGGTISMLNMALDKRIRFGIIDCAFSDLPELLLLKLKQDTKLSSKKLIMLVSIFIKIRAGFSIEDVSPVKELPTISQPILFIHGSKDDYIPSVMSKAMYSFKMDRKSLYIADGAEHGESMAIDPDQYDVEITRFLNEVYPEEHYIKGH
ncbi:MAG TPA: alpha/beta hydrolase [Proteiniclasticum sp.]|nr:alpha/beta hydrolase [Proteiniclasticum sp.]